MTPIPPDMHAPRFAPRTEVYYVGFSVGSPRHDWYVAAGRRLVGVDVRTYGAEHIFPSLAVAQYDCQRQEQERYGADAPPHQHCILRGLFTGRFQVKRSGVVAWEVVALDVAYDPSAPGAKEAP